MKVLRVITSMNPKSGGPCQGIRNSIPYLKQVGICNEVVCLDSSKEDYSLVDDFKIHKLGNGRSGYKYHGELVNWLIENLENYTHVIVHGLWQFPNFAVYNSSRKLKALGKKVPKIAIMPHGMLDPYFQKAKERRFKALRNKLIWRITEKKAINNADALFFTCQEELKLAKTTFKGYSPKKEVNVGYGIQKPPQFRQKFSEAFFQKLPNLENEYWLFLSRIHSKKGVDILINSYKNLVINDNSIPDLVIAGPLGSDYAKEMIKLAGGHPKVHFSGMLTGDEKWGALYNCKTFVLPSYQENFGIAVVEAMACRKPVLISKEVNIWREISDMKGGWFFNNLTTTSIYNTLEEISLKPKEQIEEAGVNAQVAFQNLFYSEKQSEVLLKELNEL